MAADKHCSVCGQIEGGGACVCPATEPDIVVMAFPPLMQTLTPTMQLRWNGPTLEQAFTRVSFDAEKKPFPEIIWQAVPSTERP
jgi:hypothetical protein